MIINRHYYAFHFSFGENCTTDDGYGNIIRAGDLYVFKTKKERDDLIYHMDYTRAGNNCPCKAVTHKSRPKGYSRNDLVEASKEFDREERARR